jgi:CRP/FNR family transcriptional regulator, cyclic AMP receptor protein
MSSGGGFSLQNRTEFAAGTEIFHEGQDADAAFLVLEGQVEVRKRTGDGHKVMATLGNGDVLGEMALFGGDVRSADAVAVTDTKAFRLSRADFEGRLASTDAVLRRMVTILVARLRDATEELSRRRGGAS